MRDLLFQLQLIEPLISSKIVACKSQVSAGWKPEDFSSFEAPHLFMFLYIFCIGGGGLDCQLWKEPTGDRYTSLCAPGADGPLSVVFGVWCAWWWQRFCSTSGRHQKQLSSGSHEPRDISCHSRCYVHCSVAKLGWHMNLLQMPFRLLRQQTSTAQLPWRLKHESYEHTIDHERSMYWQITEEWLAHLSVQPVSQRGIDHYLPSKRLINHFRRNHQTE